jgi:type VI secretion system protein
MKRRVGRLTVATAVASLSLYCGMTARNTRLQLRVQVAADVNDDRPIPVDVVFVWDKATAVKLDALTAKDWFEKKAAMRRDDPKERTFTAREWEWVPGQEVPDIDLNVPAASRQWLRAIFVFANYRTEGPHRAHLSPGSASIALLRNDFRVESAVPPPKAPAADKEK